MALTFATDLSGVDAEAFTEAVIADLAAQLGLDPSEILFLTLQGGSVILTVQLSPDAYDQLQAAFSAGTAIPAGRARLPRGGAPGSA